jgi:metal-responsive CopG/Arc/MetJ family transcriptional regulator
VNVKLDETLVREVEELVKKGVVKTKKEAFSRALKLLLREYRAKELAERIDRIREGTEGFGDVSRGVVDSHEEEG